MIKFKRFKILELWAISLKNDDLEIFPRTAKTLKETDLYMLPSRVWKII